MKEEHSNELNIDTTKLTGNKILLAHSGGLDSSVLGHLLLKAKLNFSVAHCNFQLRGSESDKDAQFVESWCRDNAIPFFSVRLSTEAHKNYYKKSTQVAARELRYKWFDALIKGYGFDLLLTAHHLNDQLETFLINATRGTGISGLLGIQEQADLLRPLRSLPKKELIQYAQAQGVLWREDSSNASDDYLRNALRHHVIPELEQVVPNALQHFHSTLHHLTLANDFIQESLEALKQKFFTVEEDQIKIEIKELLQLPSLAFCAHHWFSPYGLNSKEVIKLLNADSGKVIASETHRLIRDRSDLILTKKREIEKKQYTFDPTQSNIDLPILLKCEEITPKKATVWDSHQAALDKMLLKKPLSLRKSTKGDYFYPIGMKGKKLLSKFFKDEKYSLLEKEQQWLLCSEDQIVWVIGKRCDKRFVATESTKDTLLITVV